MEAATDSRSKASVFSSGIVHPQKAHHFSAHRNGRGHEALDTLRRQNLIGLGAGVIVRRQRGDVELPLLPECLKPAFHSGNGNILEIFNLRRDTLTAPLKGIVEYPPVCAHLKDIGAVCIVVFADILQNAVQCLPVLGLIQIIPQKLFYRLFPALLHTILLPYFRLNREAARNAFRKQRMQMIYQYNYIIPARKIKLLTAESTPCFTGFYTKPRPVRCVSSE